MNQSVQQFQLQQIVSGLSEGVILIAPDQSIVWANDAALAMHGVTTIRELGADVDAYRTNYALTYRNNQTVVDGQAPIDRVVAGEAVHDVVVEVTRTGRDRADWVHSIRSLVLTDDDDKPECLVLTITDVTERYEAEQRFQSSFHANPAPAVICRLSDLRFIKVNRGFLEMTGYAHDEVVGRSVYEIDVLKDAERRDLAVERLHEGGTIPQMEACLRVPADESKWVIVAGQPIEMPGKVSCMLFTFADLEARRKAEEDLKQSQEQFEKSFQLAPIPTIRGRREGLTITDANEAFTAVFGYTAAELHDHRADELGLWVDGVARERFERRLKRDGTVRGFEGRLRASDGHEIDALISADTVAISGESWVLCTIQDITDRKRSEAELKKAIEGAMADASWFSRKILDKLAALRATPAILPPPGGLDELTAREREILVRVAQGSTDDNMAEEFGISRNTVRNHLTALYRKLGVNRRSAAVVFAREHGLIEGSRTDRSGRAQTV
ncbi:helix-turn-helix transcriptional regulator [Lichenibacterium minor]|uniref:Helix-turn-helix transcriptional regulator n=1 Tax=Lichenibacterium minor TaxID=2316528 RepID=A0A4Q2U615_9HYPH|nr:helix-turn-helix transcriptional regulator [Lichenibacterium minor]RYC30417.1 helix-turn-helix transcriptional regulator [Lichenibacterium minor]